jgi:hypothetical protein
MQPITYRNIRYDLATPTGMDAYRTAINTPVATTPPAVDRTSGIGSLGIAQTNQSNLGTTYNSIQTTSDEQKQKDRQDRINAINEIYTPRYAQQEKEAADTALRNQSRVSALTSSAGLTGSPYATSALEEQRGLDTKSSKAERDLLDSQKMSEINDAFATVDKLAIDRAKLLKEEAKLNVDAKVAFYQQQETDAKSAITRFGANGATLEDLKTSDIKTYNTLKEVSGLSDFEITNLLTSADQNNKILKTEVTSDGTVVNVVQKANGKIDVQRFPTNITGNETFQLVDGVGYGMKKDANGNLVMRKLTSKETETPAGENPQLYNGLSSKTATAVRSKASAFKAEPTIQNFAILQEGRNFATSMSNTTTNPADDQGLIYALAKVLDPGSVVREGEYATAQKYSQSWVNAFGKGVTQALLGTGFLSQEARANIKKTIEQKYKSSKVSYNNLYKQYTLGINNLTGRSDGDKFISDYAIQSNGGGVLRSPDGTQEVNSEDLTPAELQEAEDNGWQ